MRDWEDRSFVVSFAVHAAGLLVLALPVCDRPTPVVQLPALRFEMSQVHVPDPLVDPVVDLVVEVSDAVTQPGSRGDAFGGEAFADVSEQALHVESDVVITAPEALFAMRAIDAIPDAEVLMADATRSIVQRGNAGDAEVGDEGGGDAGTSFFGVRGNGNAVAYVVDCSSSMAGPPLERLKRELIYSIADLPEKSRFVVIFFNDRAIPMQAMPAFLSADAGNKVKARDWIHAVPAEGGTDPSMALGMAMAMKPSAIFLMTDGQFSFPFPDGVMVMLKNRAEFRARVNTIAFGRHAAARHLQVIAALTGGQFAAVGL